MLDMHFYRRFREGEVPADILHFGGAGNFDGKHFKDTEQRSQVDLFAEDDTFRLVKVGKVRCVYFIVAEAARNTEVFARDFCLCQLMCGQYRALAAEQELSGKISVKVIVPAAASAVPARFMNFRNTGKEGFLDSFGVCGIF